MSGIDDVILGRRSVGKLTDEPIPHDVVRDLIALACAAPNHHMHQPWRFVVVHGEARRRLGAAHSQAFRRTHPQASEAQLQREFARFERAPVVIVVIAASPGEDTVTRRESRDAVAAAVQNLLLGAHARGLGAMWRTGTMPDEAELQEALGLHAGEEIVAFVYLGHAAMTPPVRPRRPVDDVITWLG